MNCKSVMNDKNIKNDFFLAIMKSLVLSIFFYNLHDKQPIMLVLIPQMPEAINTDQDHP